MHFIVDAEPAARQAGAARPLAQRVVLEEDRVVLLQHLGGLGLRDADGGAAVGEAVVVAITLLRGPRHGGLDSEKSKCRSVPSFLTVRRIASGSGSTPSESTKASPRYTPSGIFAMWARIICSERRRSSTMHAETVSAP